MLLNLGLTIVFNFNSSITERAENSKIPDCSFIVNNAIIPNNLKDKLLDTSNVTDVEMRDALFINGSLYGGKASDVTIPTIVLNRDDNNKYGKFKIISKLEDPDEKENSGYVTLWLEKYYGCKLGDKITYKFNYHDYDFIIQGFVEDMQYGNNNCNTTALYLSDKNFQTFKEKYSDRGIDSKLINVMGKSRDQSEYLYHDCNETLSRNCNSSVFNGTNYTDLLGYRTMLIDILGAIVILVAFIITLISLFVCGFRIKNGISEDIECLGIMKSLGFSSTQAKLSISTPYVLLCFISSVLGIGASFFIIPAFNGLIESIAAVNYDTVFLPSAIITTLIVLLLTVIITISLSTKKIKKLTPVVALQSGIEHHNFKHNPFPIDKTHLNVNLNLGFKNFFSMLKHNIALFFVMIVLTFLVIFGFSGFYNLNIHAHNFLNIISEEFCNAVVITKNDATKAQEILNKTKGIDKTLIYESVKINFEKTTIEGYCCDDYSKCNNDLCYKGRNPIHNNEVCLGSAFDKDYSIGQTITLKDKDSTKEYLIVGFSQAPNSYGRAVFMTVDGYKELNKNYVPEVLYVYNGNGKTTEQTVDLIKQNCDDISDVTNIDKQIDSSMGTYLSLTAVLASTILLIVIVITVLILFIMFSTFILQNRTDFGILKSLGYTSKLIITQSVLALLPSLFLGILGGCVLANFFMPNAWLLILSSMNVRKCNLNVPLFVNIITGVFLLLCSMLISILLISKSIRKVTPTKLINE